MGNNIIVSVFMMAYNHEKYVAQALDSVLMQKVDFEYQIVLGEDCSTDNTREIVINYAERYPKKFKLLLHKTNIGAVNNQNLIFAKCTGKYIAMLECDDYWTDPLKLQKQVEFLEMNEDFSFCFHSVYREINGLLNKDKLSVPKALPINSEFKISDLILEGGSFVPICSIFFKNNFENKFPTWFYDSPVGDLPLVLYLATRGKIGFIDDVMSVYRVASNIDSWTNKMKNWKRRRIHYFNIKKMWNEYDKFTDNKYTTAIREKINLNKKNFLKNEFYVIMDLLKSKLK